MCEAQKKALHRSAPCAPHRTQIHRNPGWIIPRWKLMLQTCATAVTSHPLDQRLDILVPGGSDFTEQRP